MTAVIPTRVNIGVALLLVALSRECEPAVVPPNLSRLPVSTLSLLKHPKEYCQTESGEQTNE
jgi:hypothetical protein